MEFKVRQLAKLIKMKSRLGIESIILNTYVVVVAVVIVVLCCAVFHHVHIWLRSGNASTNRFQETYVDHKFSDVSFV